MTLPYHRSRGLPAAIAVCVLLASLLTSHAADGDRDACARNLQSIWNGIQKYREANKSLPANLSDLVPTYISNPSVMICPVTRRTGEIKNLGYSDPKLSSSYIYEFGGFRLPEATATVRYTLRDWRQLQMAQVGSIVPVLRCLHHQRILNMSFDGKIYETAGDWEAELANVIDPESLTAKNLLAGAEFFVTGVRSTGIRPVDLTDYYNVALDRNLGKSPAALRHFPKGRTEIQDIPFEVNGVIQLWGTGLEGMPPETYPQSVRNIAIDANAARLHFIIGASYSAERGTKVASITVNYEDGTSEEVPIQFDLHLTNWWFGPPQGNSPLRLAWSGAIIDANGENPAQIGAVYLLTWENPRIDSRIKSLDFTSALTQVAPFIVGISTEAP